MGIFLSAWGDFCFIVSRDCRQIPPNCQEFETVEDAVAFAMAFHDRTPHCILL